MTRRRLGWLALFSWIIAAIGLDSLRDLPGMIARRHAGIFAPWPEYFTAAVSLLLAMLLTALWLKSLRVKHN